jgi:hypothetical protein
MLTLYFYTANIFFTIFNRTHFYTLCSSKGDGSSKNSANYTSSFAITTFTTTSTILSFSLYIIVIIDITSVILIIIVTTNDYNTKQISDISKPNFKTKNRISFQLVTKRTSVQCYRKQYNRIIYFSCTGCGKWIAACSKFICTICRHICF